MVYNKPNYEIAKEQRILTSINIKEDFMASEDYSKAYKLGKKEYQYRMMKGMQPTLQVLDDILPV